MASSFYALFLILVSLGSLVHCQTPTAFCPSPTVIPYSPNNIASYPFANQPSPIPSQMDVANTYAVFDPAQQSVRDYIVQKHNCLRTQTTPAATNMKELTWNAELAQTAQALADTCSGNHRQATTTDCPSGVGQNLFESNCGANCPMVYSWKYAIDSWFNERNLCTGPNSGLAQSGTCTVGDTGHYTQVAWADSYQVGCGFKSCPGGNNYFVCNYCNQGNFNNLPPYTAGAPCGSCPAGTACDPKGQLCLKNGAASAAPPVVGPVGPDPNPPAAAGRPNGYDRCDLTYCKDKDGYYDPQPCSRNYCKCSSVNGVKSYQTYSCAAGKYFTKAGGTPQCKAPDASFCPTKTTPNPLPTQSPWPVTAPASLSKFCNAQNCADRASFKYYPLDKCSPYRCHCDPVRVVVCPDGQYWDFRSEIEQCTSKYLLPYCNGKEF